MLRTTNQQSRGFTIVELLIVIVVIAILAAISIVAYNGIQERARNTTAADSASQLKTKIEAWNAVNGEYPTKAEVDGGLVDNTAPTADEAKIDAGLLDKILASGAVSAGDPLQVCEAEDGGGNQTGVQITYWQSAGGGGNKTILLGSGTCA